MTRTSTDTRLFEALTRLLAGPPTLTDGALTVSNLCREAGVSRHSYYRSPVKDRFIASRQHAEVHQPEVVRLRDEVRDLKAARRTDQREAAQQMAALEDLVRTYANQIQALTLANEELAADNRRLRQAVERTCDKVSSLRPD